MIYKIKQEILDINKRLEHMADVIRLQQICLANGYHTDTVDCYLQWKLCSIGNPGDWLILPGNDIEIWNKIKSGIIALAK